MTSRVAALAVLVAMIMAAPRSNAQTVVLGTRSVLSGVDNDSSGKAEAFRTVSTYSGTINSISVYLDPSSSAQKVFVGIYSDSNGHPQTLLGSGTISSPIAGQWNAIAISPAVSVSAGTAYHETILGTGGTIQYRDTNNGGHSETSAQTTLTALPATWSSGQSWPSAPISFYGSGSINSNGSGGSSVAITVSPSAVTISPGATQQFNATVSGSNNTAVNWSVVSGGGSINSSGLYTAPSSSGSVTIQAQSQADTTKTATATVTVASSVAVSISPASATVSPGKTQQFTATVTGTSNTAVNWSVIAGRGSINSSGLYTASLRSGSATVQARSQADTTKTATAAVTIASAVAVSISPTTAAVPQSGTRQFTATVSGSSNSSVTWSLSGPGTLSSSGLYTAPNAQASAVVTATSVADSTKSASAGVTVPAVSISVSPISPSVPPNGTQQFTASVSGTTNTGVTWSDTGNGSVNSTGLYTAPGSGESDTVTATSVADATKSATASVTVQQQSASQCGNTLNWTSSTCQQIGSGQLNTAVVNGANDPNAWTVISRHGEYAQNETECNIPNAISAGNGQLNITTSAVSTKCGDFNTDGTTRTSPQNWPYSTGAIQTNTFNFKYGTVVYNASVPSGRTNLWPGLLWILTSSCQTTNKYSGDTGFSGCPNVGSSGYTEIDPLECYNGNDGWCQFHVANPGFGIGGGCDASIPVSDTGFHTIMLIWSPTSIKQYTDGVLKTTCNQALSQPMFLIVQTQTGGAGGTPNNSLLPATAAMQYVKVCSSTDGSCASVHDNDPSVEFVDRFGGPAQ